MLARIVAFFRKRRLDRELDDELASHLELLADDNIKRGMDPETARRDARIRIGSFDAAKALHRETRGLPWLDSLIQDVQLAFRMIRKSPWISGVAIASLAIGIGANVTGFAIARTILWKPLPVPEPHRLIALYNRNQNGTGTYSGLAYPEYEYLRRRHELFDDLALYVRVTSFMDAGDAPERVVTEIVTSNFFSSLGVPTILGRGFQPGDDRARGSALEAILSYTLWQSRFSADRNVIGRRIRLDNREFTIVGVASEEFRGVLMDWVDPPQVWVPVNMIGDVFRATEARYGSVFDLWLLHSLMVTGRLREGVTIESAQQQIRALDAQMTAEHPERVAAFNGKYEAVMQILPLQQARFFPAYRPAVVSYIRIVAAIMAIVLGIACLNLVNLMIARATTRARELAVRAALGATRLRLLMQMVVESLILSSIGGLIAFPVALVLWRALLLFERPFLVVLPPSFDVDVWTVAFTAAVSAGTGIIFGIWPAFRASRIDLNNALKQQKGASRFGGVHARSVLIGIQIAASVVLLVGAVLFVLTVRNAEDVDRFVDRSHVGIVELTLPANRSSEVLARVREIPGIENASIATVVPGGSLGILYSAVTSTAKISVDQNSVSHGFFKLMGIPLLSGRDFTEADRKGAPEVVIINESLARRLWPEEDPLGRTVSGATVIGVVKDIRSRGARRPVPSIVYSTILQRQPTDIKLLIQTTERPGGVFSVVRQTIRGIDSEIRIANMTVFSDFIDKSLSTERLTATLVSSLGVVALCLTLIGLYAVVAFAAAARTREIGIRRAIGAQIGQILVMMFAENIAVVLGGLLLGLIGTLAMTQLVQPLLYGVESIDAASMIFASASIFILSSFAIVVPSWSASRLNPSAVLRND